MPELITFQIATLTFCAHVLLMGELIYKERYFLLLKE